MLWMLIAAVVAIASLGVGTVVLSRRPPLLGPQQGRLRPCPDTPNCVCTHDADHSDGMAALDAHGHPLELMNRLRILLRSSSGVRIVADEGLYLHAEFRTPVLRFIDDVEFLADETAGVIHVRSASRVGYSDFGTNRRRIEWIRRQLEEDGR
jgi:uncharacterized protein (DUF1499 family)